MKKLYLSLLSAVVAFGAANAQYYDGQLEIPENTTAYIYLEEGQAAQLRAYTQEYDYETGNFIQTEVPLHDGMNDISFPSEDIIYLNIATRSQDYKINSVFVLAPGEDEPVDMIDEFYDSFKSCVSIPVYSEYNEYQGLTEIWDGFTYSFAITSLAESRSAVAHVFIDNPELVESIEIGYGTFTIENPVAGEWFDFNFNPADEYDWTFRPVKGRFYSITQNDVEVEYDYGYGLEVEDGDYIKVLANFPDEKKTLTFSVNDDQWNAFYELEIDHGNYDYETIEDFTQPVQVNMGDAINLRLNADEMKIVSLKVNGEEQEEYSTTNYSNYAVIEDLAFEVEARPYRDLPVTFYTDHAELLTVTSGSSYYWGGVEHELEGEESVLHIAEQAPYLIVEPASGYVCNIMGFDMLGEEVEFEVSGGKYYIDVAQNNIVTVLAEVTEFVRDLNAYIYVDDASAFSSFGFSNCDYDKFYANDESYDCPLIQNGYNALQFAKSDNDFYVFCYMESGIPYIYQNNELVEQNAYAFLTLADKDVVKFFTTGEPAEYTISFVAAESTEAQVIADKFTEVAVAEGHTCLQGTEFVITNAEAVLVDGTAVEANAEGAYIFTATDNHLVTITEKENGISNVSVDNANNTNDIFDLSGRRINGKPAAGIYVVNGSKLIIK